MIDDERPYDWTDPEVIAARTAVERAIVAYMQIIRPDEQPLVLGWQVGIEWTNMELEQSGRAGRDVIAPTEQLISASLGLGAYIVNRYT